MLDAVHPFEGLAVVDPTLEASPGVMQAALCAQIPSLRAAFAAACASIWRPVVMLWACRTYVTPATCSQ